MGQKTHKIGHYASRAIERPKDASKEDILKLYARLKEKENFIGPCVSQEFDGAEEKIDVGGLIELLGSDMSETLIGALKTIEQIAEYKLDGLSKVTPIVLRLLKVNSDENVRYGATKALAKLKDQSVSGELVDTVKHDPSEKVKEGAVKALGSIKANDHFDLVADILNQYWDQSIRVRKAAAFALSRLEPEAALGILTNCILNDPDKDVRREAAESVAVCILKMEKNKADTIAHTIATQIDHKEEPECEVRLSVINAITVAESISCVEPLLVALKEDPNPRVRGQAANALAHFFDPRIEKALIESLDRETDGTKKRIALAVAQYAMKNPLGLHDEVCGALIKIQKLFPRDSYIWKEAVKALPAC